MTQNFIVILFCLQAAIVILFNLTARQLHCTQLLNERVLSISCLPPTESIDTATCAYDDGPASPCEYINLNTPYLF